MIFPENKLAVICERIPGNELVAAECANLTGGTPAPDGFGLCQTLEHIHNSAYVRMGLHLIAHGSTLDDLLAAVVEANFPADGFRIDFQSLSKQVQISKSAAIAELATVIPAYPDLDHPQHRFLLLVRDDGLWFGEVLSKCEHRYIQHEAKPHHTTASLPSRLARALVNLVVPPARSLIDPCCGTGSILLEAQSLGMQAYGADWNWQGVEMTRKNLAHFGYQAVVERADARTCTHTADALVTDLPYGRFSVEDEAITRAILERGRTLASLAVYVTGHSITDWLAAAGYHEIEQYQVSKHTGFTRYVHIARG